MPKSLRTVLGPLLVWVLATGCSSTTSYRRPTSPAEAAWVLDKIGKDEVALVIASAHGPIANRGVLAPFDAHSFVFVDRAGQALVIPFAHTQSITYTSRANGAGLGFLYGVIPGFLAGFIAGLALEEPVAGAVVGTVGGLLTGGIGATLGAAIGNDATLTF